MLQLASGVDVEIKLWTQAGQDKRTSVPARKNTKEGPVGRALLDS